MKEQGKSRSISRSRETVISCAKRYKSDCFYWIWRLAIDTRFKIIPYLPSKTTSLGRQFMLCVKHKNPYSDSQNHLGGTAAEAFQNDEACERKAIFSGYFKKIFATRQVSKIPQIRFGMVPIVESFGYSLRETHPGPTHCRTAFGICEALAVGAIS